MDSNWVEPNLRFRRILNVSPKTEVRVPVGGRLTSVFGEWLVVSPMTEVWNPFFRVCNLVLRRILNWSPMVEVRFSSWGCLTSVFGEWFVCRR